MALCGAVIYLAVFLILTSVSFWFEDRVGIVPPVFNMLTFARYPLTIYNVFVQFLLSWIIPFGFATFYPTTHFLGRRTFAPYFYLVPAVGRVFPALHLGLEQGRGELQQHGIMKMAPLLGGEEVRGWCVRYTRRGHPRESGNPSLLV